jgi:hypothetical protein
MSAYLTFDDGPIYPNTERVLEILRKASRLPRTSTPCGRSSPAPACRRFVAWTASAST